MKDGRLARMEVVEAIHHILDLREQLVTCIFWVEKSNPYEGYSFWNFPFSGREKIVDAAI